MKGCNRHLTKQEFKAKVVLDETFCAAKRIHELIFFLFKIFSHYSVGRKNRIKGNIKYVQESTLRQTPGNQTKPTSYFVWFTADSYFHQIKNLRIDLINVQF